MNCKGRLILLLLGGLFLYSPTSFSQPIKTKKVVQQLGPVTYKYHVQKSGSEENATQIKHGNYLEEVEAQGEQYILKQGAYVDNKAAGQWVSYHYGTTQVASSGWFVSGNRSGEWQFFYSDGSLKMVGAYKGGKETGIWRCYYPGSSARDEEKQQIFCEGSYVEGQKQGNWQFFGPDGALLERIDFSAGKLLQSNAYDNELARAHLLFSVDSSHQVVAEELTYEKLDSPPIFPGGAITLYKSLFPDLTFPGKTKTAKRMVVRATVNHDGSSVDYRIESGLDPQTDLEVLNRLNQLEDHWKPGIFEGSPVAVVVFIPLGFTGALPEIRQNYGEISNR